MIKHIYTLLSLIILLKNVTTQSCLNSQGLIVSWWVILKVPPTIGNSGYAYYDSSTQTGTFVFANKTVDLEVSPFTQTMSIINKDSLQRIAWNDQKPDGTTSSSKAHAKGVIAYSLNTSRGFLFVHSIPKFPAFLANHSINLTIPKAQQVYGQHLSCFSLSLYQLNLLASNLQIIHPNIYQNLITLRATNKNLYDLGNSVFPTRLQLFQYYNMRPTGYSINAIFKNNNLNGSIFEDGLIKWSNNGKATAETWGRPLETSWCSGKFEMKNVLQIKINDQIIWNESQDHSKWAVLGSKYSCFGDMNRMSSQWKRGGAFYCLEEPTLIAAMGKIITVSDTCSTVPIFKYLLRTQ